MLKLFIVILTFVIHTSISLANNFAVVPDSIKNKGLKIDIASTDSVEYELLVFDTQYETFLLMQPPVNFYDEKYYKIWNNQYVNEWNYRYNNPSLTDLYETYIDYDEQKEYGIKLEYRLYYFFRYFEIKNHLKLISRGH